MTVHIVSCVLIKNTDTGTSMLNPVYVIETDIDDDASTYTQLYGLLAENNEFDGYEICSKQIVRYNPGVSKLELI